MSAATVLTLLSFVGVAACSFAALDPKAPRPLRAICWLGIAYWTAFAVTMGVWLALRVIA